MQTWSELQHTSASIPHTLPPDDTHSVGLTTTAAVAVGATVATITGAAHVSVSIAVSYEQTGVVPLHTGSHLMASVVVSSGQL